jgi:hypothetical protein
MFRIMSSIARMAAILFFVVGSSSAFAATAVKEISGFNVIKAEFTNNAQKCGFESLEPFERQLRKELEVVGIAQNSQSIIEVSLEIGGIVYGTANSQCAVNVSLDFRTTLTAANINTDNPAIRAAVDRLGAFPVSLYKVGAFAVSTTLYTVYDNRNITQAEAAILKMIHRLVTRLAEERKK